ncbi:MAG: VOC family protein [Propionibacteriaceae bacterium]|jgi:predicted enzyme related to lactoylglutathione lyase|nr:VOC family protein [Propionibacteriaceae bacterium]
MSVKISGVTMDTLDPQRLAQWWADQIDGQIAADLGGVVFVSTESGVNLCLQRVPEPTPGKNRLHLDCTTTDVESEVAKFLAAGAELVAQHEVEGFAWTVLADPDGNQFCVCPAE